MALPGVKTVLKDRFYTLSRTDIPVGPRVLAIAARNTADGTSDGLSQVFDYDPYYATNEKNVIAAYGEGSGCHRAYLELVAGGATRCYIVALPKGITDANIRSTTPVTVTGDGTDHNHGSHIPFDKAFEAVETAQVDIVVPWGRGGHPLEWEETATPNDDPPFGFYADNTATAANSMVKRVGDACADITDRSHPIFAVMGVKPFVDSNSTGRSTTGAMTASQISTHLNFTNLADNDNTGMGVNGSYVSVVASELQPLGYDLGVYGYSNGACLYAGAIAQLVSYSATTGKLVYNVQGVRYNPTRTQQDTLTTKGLVPVALDFTRIPTWVDGVTFGKSTSDFTRLSTLRIVFETILLVRRAAQPFVGEGATISNRNSLETAIAATLRSMQQTGALVASDFVTSYFPSQNKALIDLVVTPAFELRTIEIQVAVQL